MSGVALTAPSRPASAQINEEIGFAQQIKTRTTRLAVIAALKVRAALAAAGPSSPRTATTYSRTYTRSTSLASERAPSSQQAHQKGAECACTAATYSFRPVCVCNAPQAIQQRLKAMSPSTFPRNGVAIFCGADTAGADRERAGRSKLECHVLQPLQALQAPVYQCGKAFLTQACLGRARARAC